MYTLLQNSLVFLRSKIMLCAQVIFNQFDLMDVIIVFNWVHAHFYECLLINYCWKYVFKLWMVGFGMIVINLWLFVVYFIESEPPTDFVFLW